MLLELFSSMTEEQATAFKGKVQEFNDTTKNLQAQLQAYAEDQEVRTKRSPVERLLFGGPGQPLPGDPRGGKFRW